jgi:ABC-type hemin transport system ATPase subunit
MKLKAVTINDKVISLGKLTVLVGPNNVGKSQFLRDIKSEMELGKSSRKIILKKRVRARKQFR